MRDIALQACCAALLLHSVVPVLFPALLYAVVKSNMVMVCSTDES